MAALLQDEKRRLKEALLCWKSGLGLAMGVDPWLLASLGATATLDNPVT